MILRERKTYEHALHHVCAVGFDPARQSQPEPRCRSTRYGGLLPHIGLAGDTYTILLSWNDTGGRYSLIAFHIPPGGGPAPHRHDSEESFTILEGEIETTFRSQKRTIRAGETISIPANAPHSFTNASHLPARLLCICAPAGQEKFFEELGAPAASRTAKPPELNKAAQATLMKKTKELAPKYRTELSGPYESMAETMV